MARSKSIMRILTVLLAVVICVSLLSLGALADGEDASGTCTLYLHGWDPESTDPYIVKVAYGKSYSLTTKTGDHIKAFYTFNGWYTDAESEERIYSVTNDTAGDWEYNLYARWASIPCVAYLYQADFSTLIRADRVTYGDDYIVPEFPEEYLPEGKVFRCWNSSTTLHGYSMYPGQKYTTTENPFYGSYLLHSTNRSAFLFPTFTNVLYTVQFDLNIDGSEIIDTYEMYYDQAQSLPRYVRYRNGYEFTGWNTQADGEGEHFDPGASVKNLSTKNNDTVTLYAEWSFKGAYDSYTVHFDAGPYDDVQGTMADQVILVGDTVALNPNAYSRPGFMFYRWRLERMSEERKSVSETASVKSSSVSYFYDGEEVCNLSMRNGDNVFLTAEWKPVEYVTVSFDSAGGSAVPSQTIVWGEKAVRPADPYRAGYKFDYWSVKDYQPYAFAESEPVPEEPPVDAVKSVPVAARSLGLEREDSEDKPIEKEPYDEVKEEEEAWEVDKEEFVDDTPYDFDSRVEGDLVLLAHWIPVEVEPYVEPDPDPEPETYSVTYEDGEGNVIETFEVEAGAATPTVDDPEREGYSFSGWSPEVAETVTADVTYVAQWTENEPEPEEAAEPEEPSAPEEPDDLEEIEDADIPLYGGTEEEGAEILYGSVPLTGDNSRIALWACISALAAAGIIVMLARLRKKENG